MNNSYDDIIVHTSPRFDIGKESDAADMLTFLDENGYAVIKEVADDEAIAEGFNLLWKYFESHPSCAARRGDPSTWSSDDDWLPSGRNGIMNGDGFGQCEFMWHSRMLPKVKKVFEKIWNTSELITSFDGGNVFRPWTYNPEWKTVGNWWHVDQNGYLEENRDRMAVQGFLSYTAANASTGGLCVIAGSHKHFTEMTMRNPLAYMEGDFLKCQKDDPLVSAADLEKRLVCCEAGDFVVWDSRTVHCNCPSVLSRSVHNGEEVAGCGQVEGCSSSETVALNALGHTNVFRVAEEGEGHTAASKDPKPIDKQEAKDTTSVSVTNPVDIIRLVAYVCMTPTKAASAQVLGARRNCFIYHISTSHWPFKNIPTYTTAKTQTREISSFPPHKLSTLSMAQRDLIDGYGSKSSTVWQQAYERVEEWWNHLLY